MPTRGNTAHSQAVAKHLQAQDSTHGVAPEASAARFILILREAYPSPSQEASHSPVDLRAQGTLIHYLQQLSLNLDFSLSPEEASNPSITETLKVITFINTSGVFTKEEKQKIFTQMSSIASTCPSMDWNPTHERWSTNRLYNPTENKDELIIASPAETLNLVCKALLDKERYDMINAKDEQARMESLAGSLLKLQEQKEQGQYNLCSAGRQHEMLALLHRSYLDKPQCLNGKALEFIVSTDIFLLESLSLYIEEAIARLPKEAQSMLILNWARWQAGLNEVDESPLLTWLTHDSTWKSKCEAYLAHRCEAFGLNPALCALQSTIDSIEDMSIPATENMLMPLVVAIVNRPLLPRHQGMRDDEKSHCIALSNLALIQMQEVMTPLFITTHAQAIKDFYTALEAMKTLQEYHQLAVFIGEEEGAFQSACLALQNILINYYHHFEPGKQLAPEFSGCHSTFLREEPKFKKRSHANFIANFFASVSAQGYWTVLMSHLIALKTPQMNQHPILLSDEALRQWYEQSTTRNDDGSLSMDVSPYQINRILLHALLESPRAWTPLYTQVLQQVTEWLLKPEQSENSLEFITLRASYPENLLNNLLFISLILNRSELADTELRESLLSMSSLQIRGSYDRLNYNPMQSLLIRILSKTNIENIEMIWTTISHHLNHLIIRVEELTDLFNSVHIERLSSEQCTMIIDTIGPRLSLMFSNINQFKQLFSLNPINLSTLQRNQIFMHIKDQLPLLITTPEELYLFCKINAHQLNVEQRNDVLQAITPRINTLIKSGEDISRLFHLSPECINNEQKDLILQALEPQLTTILNHEDAFYYLFLLPLQILSINQRQFILKAIATQLGKIMTSRKELLFHLFSSLHLKNLSMDDRNFILGNIKTELSSIITNTTDLHQLFSIPKEQLSKEQRHFIINVIEDQFEAWIKNGKALYDIFSLPPELLRSKKRAALWSIVQTKLKSLTINGADLAHLFLLPLENLSSEQRFDLWNAIEHRSHDLIRGEPDLRYLYDLSEKNLSLKQRTQIWEAIKTKLSSLFVNMHNLKSLFTLPITKLTTELRTTILEEIVNQGHLTTLIKPVIDKFNLNKEPLYDLFISLSVEKLNIDQRSYILRAIKDQLGSIITSKNLMDFFLLSSKQLNTLHRHYILSAIKDKLALFMNQGALKSLFSLSIEHLSPQARDYILNAIKNPEGAFIIISIEIFKLFQLSTTLLSIEQRTQFLNDHYPQLRVIAELRLLFSLPQEQLTKAHRMRLLDAFPEPLIESDKTELARLKVEVSSLQGEPTNSILVQSSIFKTEATETSDKDVSKETLKPPKT